MRNLILRILILCCLPLAVKAQAQYADDNDAYAFPAGHEAVVFADTANVRSAAAPSAQIVDRLGQGSVVKILRTGAEYELNGKSTPWCAVSYQVNGVSKTGFLWSGLLSPRVLRRGEVRFVYGMQFPPNDTAQTIVDIKALRHDSLIARTSFMLASTESARGLHQARVAGNKGLKGLDCLIYFYYSGEACAIPTYEQYIGWDGRRFVRLPQLTTTADAGIYVYEERFIFPADKGGMPGLLLKKERSEESDDNGKPVKKSNKTIRYKWDAGQLRLVKQ